MRLLEAIGLAIALGRGYDAMPPERMLEFLPPDAFIGEPDSYVIRDRYFFPASCLSYTLCRAVGRAAPWVDAQGRCIIHINPHLKDLGPDDDEGLAYWFVLVHEWGHCNGWPGHHWGKGTANVTVEFMLEWRDEWMAAQ